MDNNNIIESIFSNIFSKIFNRQDFYEKSFASITSMTFDRQEISDLIAEYANYPERYVSSYVTDKCFIRKFLFQMLNRKVNVDILVGELSDVKRKCEQNYIADHTCLILAALNDRLDVLEYLIDTIKLQPTKELLYSSCHNATTYQYLRKKTDMLPNLSVLYRAVRYGNDEVCGDILEYISPNILSINEAVESNQTHISELLIDKVITSKNSKNIRKEIILYPIVNGNMSLVKKMVEKSIIKWSSELLFSAILSGSMDMIKYIESRYSHIHASLALDKTTNVTKNSNNILKDTTYAIDGVQKYAHTMNYAVQSNDTAIIKYVHGLGYGISASNFITALKQSSCHVLENLSKFYRSKLPYYVVYYFSIWSVINDKIDKAKILLEYGLLDFTYDIGEKNMARISDGNFHIDLLKQKQVVSNEIVDSDYFLDHNRLFSSVDNSCIYPMTITRLILELNLPLDLLKKSPIIHTENMSDIIYLYGTVGQIKYCIRSLVIRSPPSEIMLSHLTLTNQMGKIACIFNNMEMPHGHKLVFAQSCCMVGNEIYSRLSEKLVGYIEITDKFKFIIESRSVPSILDILDENIVLDKKNLRIILSIDNDEITSKLYSLNKIDACVEKWMQLNDLKTARPL